MRGEKSNQKPEDSDKLPNLEESAVAEGDVGVTFEIRIKT